MNPPSEGISSHQDPIFLLGVIIFTLVALSWALVTVLGLTRKSQITEANKKINQIDAEVKGDKKIADTLKQYSGVESVTSHIDKILGSQFLFLPGWNKVKDSVPQDIAFNSITMGADGAYNLTGTSKSVGAVSVFSTALAGKTDVLSVTPIAVDKQENGSFNFTLNFKMKKVGGGAK